MTEILIQRRDRAGYWEKYPLYVNRELVARIGFGETYTLKLEPGRYQIHCGGLLAVEDSVWLDVGNHRKALFLSAQALARKERPWPKYYRMVFTETTPIQLKKEEDQAQLGREQAQALMRAFSFLALLSVGAAWLFWQADLNDEPVLLLFAFIALGLMPWAYRGVLLSQLKQA